MLRCGMLPMVSMINHSCCPNVELRPELPNTLHVHASTELQADEELMVSYLTEQQLGLPVEQRMEELQSSFGFACACVRCEAEARAAA